MLAHILGGIDVQNAYSHKLFPCIVSGVVVGWLAQRIVGTEAEMIELMDQCYTGWEMAEQKLIGLVVGLAIVGIVSWWMKRAERKRRGW